jgi:type II secretory pathway predicted ATPase ExeA
MTDTGDRALVDTRRAAVAKLLYAVERPGGVALLCGPAGTGKTVVLEALAATLGPRAARRSLAGWVESTATRDLPDVVIADDAHAADVPALVDLMAACRGRRPESSLVLAGEGRLLSLVSRDPRLVRAVGLRAVLRPFTVTETRGLLDATLFAAGPGSMDADARASVSRTIHEIAGGIPAAVVRLAELVAVVAAARADGAIADADVEAIHRRLSLQAA